jgi:hypothetical protein
LPISTVPSWQLRQFFELPDQVLMFVGSLVPPYVSVASPQVKVLVDNSWFHRSKVLGTWWGVWQAIQSWPPGAKLLRSWDDPEIVAVAARGANVQATMRLKTTKLHFNHVRITIHLLSLHFT